MARVLVVDDSKEFRAVMCDWIAMRPGLELVGEAADGTEAVDLVERLRPDLVLMDAIMHRMDGFEATRQIKSRPDPPQVVILTLHDSGATRPAAEAAGADGFVAKSDLTEALPRLLHELIEK